MYVVKGNLYFIALLLLYAQGIYIHPFSFILGLIIFLSTCLFSTVTSFPKKGKPLEDTVLIPNPPNLLGGTDVSFCVNVCDFIDPVLQNSSMPAIIL